MQTVLTIALRLTLVMALAGTTSSCMFRELRRNLEEISKLTMISGAARATLPGDAITVVILTRGDTREVVDSFVIGARGKFFFAVEPGTYSVGAFVDRDRNLRYDPATERGVWFGAPQRFELTAGRKIENVDIDLDSAVAVRIDTPEVAPELGRRGIHELPDLSLGSVASFDDPRFTDENGKFGLWQPVDFALKNYSGIYFTEPFDPKKIPVLFVHGITGHPGNFKYLVEHLDHDKFQAWLVYYPSGMRLQNVGAALLRWVGATAVNYPFDRIVVVAHSMGGLVARSMINQWTQTVGSASRIKLLQFVSISTPWGGHQAAAAGVEKAPEVVPAWIDMAPGSEFLRTLYDTPLPAETPFTLLFGFEGGSTIVGGVNDGTVHVASELYPRAQDQALKIYGYPQSHMGILGCEEVSNRLNGILAAAAED